MRMPFQRRRDYEIEPLVESDVEEVARLHAEDFARPWSGGEFSELLAQDPVFGFAAREIGRVRGPLAGFILARLAADEGEILTVAVARSVRRQGLGWRLVDAVLRALHVQRAEALFLEVEESNTGAIALYQRFGFRQVGHRPSYYQTAAGGRSGALVMRRDMR